MLPILSFSRSQEEEADSTALQAVLVLYGHVGDAAAFFEALARRQSMPKSPTMFNTHPDVEQRIARIRDFSARHVNPDRAPATPLPVFMKAG